MTHHLLAVDGTNLLYRAHHALGRSGISHAGRPIWAIHGMVLSLAKAVETAQPTHIQIALDSPGGCRHRRELQPSYKSTRTAPANELSTQLAWAPSALTQLGLACAAVPDWEADDIVASAAHQTRVAGGKTTIVTSDRDAYQLLDTTTSILTPDHKTVTVDTLASDMGLSPAQYAFLAALRGEPGDNLPGVEGIGAKTAAKLLERFGTLDAIFAATDTELREVLGAKTLANLRRDEQTARTTATVATLRRDLAIGAPCSLAAFDTDRCRSIGAAIGVPQAAAKLAWAVERAQQTHA